MALLPKNISIAFLRKSCCNIEGIWFLDLSGRNVEEHLNKRIQDEDVSTIIQFLGTNEKISHVDLSFNNITSAGFSELANFLAKDKQLISLNLMYNDIQSIDYSVSDLSIKWKLKALILAGNKFGAAASISGIIQLNKSLTRLDIGNTDQTMRSSIDILSNFLHTSRGCPNSSIKIIDLSRILPFNKVLETIYITHVIRFLEKVLLSHHFVSIRLSKNSITDFEIEILCDSLSRCTQLEILDLSCNLITSHGMELLSRILPYTNIIDLNVSSNKIADSGAEALGSVWSKTKIRYLNISNNRIQEAGLLHLVRGIRNRPAKLRTLFIYGNKITEKTAKVFYRLAYDGFVSSNVMDITFDWNQEGSLLYFEDISLKKYRDVYDIARDLSTAKKRITEKCCKNTEEDQRNSLKNKEAKIKLSLLLYKLNYFE